MVRAFDRVLSLLYPLTVRCCSVYLKMAHLTDAQLKRFQLDPEAFNLAKQVYRQIQVKTAPGSGHELGAGVIAVPAIAAYLACVQYVRVGHAYLHGWVTQSDF